MSSFTKWTKLTGSEILRNPDAPKIIDWLQRTRRIAWAIALKTTTAINPYSEFRDCLSLDDAKPFPQFMIGPLCSQCPEKLRGFDPNVYKTFQIGHDEGLCIMPCGHIFWDTPCLRGCLYCNKEYPRELFVSII